MEITVFFSLAPLLALCLNVAFHIIVNHLRKGQQLMLNLLMGFLGGGLSMLALFLWLYFSGQIASMWLGIAWFLFDSATYIALGFGYFIFINLNLASLRIRMLAEIKSAPGSTLSQNDILTKYDSKNVVENRLERLVEGGQLIPSADSFISGPNASFRILAKIMDLLKWLILGRTMAI